MMRQCKATQKKIENLLGAIALYPVGACAIAIRLDVEGVPDDSTTERSRLL
ncbi:hypothetical protein [Microseira wollei]|uniref:hypothetical protein n=1 Tax=Microseira wollei TaxID=467598 RepID=UPI001CFD78B1|nr:hypothetical protein [Microseira wollei]